MASTETKPVISVAALLNSTISDEEQLALAAEIIDYELLGTESTRPLSNPKHQRVLRWILSKIGQQEPSQGSALIDPKTYDLLSVLLRRMPLKVALAQLQQANLLKSVGECLQYTLEELSIYEAQIDRSEVSRKAVNGLYSSDGANTGSRSVSAQANALERLISVCRVLYAVQQMPFSGEDIKHINIHSQQTRHALKISFEQAVVIIETGLQCILKCIEAGIWTVGASLESQFVLALTAVWNLVSESVSSKETALANASLFAKHCLLPSLQLTLKRPTLGLERFVIEHCLLSLMEHGLNDETKLSESLSLMFVSISDRSLQTHQNSQTDSMTTAEEAKHTKHNSIPMEFEAILLIVKLLSRLNDGIKLKNKDVLEKLYREVFVRLAVFLNIDVTTPQRQRLSAGESIMMVRLLDTFQEAGISPGTNVLSNIVLYYTDQDTELFLPSTWRIIKICLELQHEMVSTFTDQSTQIIEHIFDSMTSTDRRSVDIVISSAHDEVQRSATSFLLEPLLNVIVRSRKLLQLLPFWQNHVTIALQKAVDSATTQAKGTPSVTFWELDTVQQTMCTKFICAMPFTERLTLVRNLAADVSKFLQDPQDLASFYATVIVLSTVVTSLGTASSRPSHTQQQLPHTLVWELYVSIGKYYMSSTDHDWKYHLLGLLDELRISSTQEAIPSDVVSLDNNLIQLLGTQIRQTLDLNGSSKCYRLASAAWSSLLLRFHNDISSHKILSLTVQDIFSVVVASSVGVKEGHISNGTTKTSKHVSNHNHSNDLEEADNFVHDCISTSLNCSKVYEITQSAELKTLVSNLHSRSQLSANIWQNLWNHLVCSNIAAEVSSVNHAIQQIQITGFINDSATLLESSRTDTARQLAVHQSSLQQLNNSYLMSVSKEDRGRIVNRILANLSSEALTGNWFLMSLELLSKLMERPSRLMVLVSDPQSIWNLLETLEHRLSIDCVDYLRVIAKHLLSYWMTEDKGDNSDVTVFVDALRERTHQSHGQTHHISITIVMTTAMNLFQGTINQTELISQSLQFRFLKSQIQFLKDNFPHPASGPARADPRMYAVLDNICTVPVSIFKQYWRQPKAAYGKQQNENMNDKGYFVALQRSLVDMIRSTSSAQSDLTTTLCLFRVQDVMARISDKQEGFRQDLGLELGLFPYDIQRRRLKELRNTFESLSAQEKVSALTSLSTDTANASGKEIRYLHQIVSIPFTTEERGQGMKLALQQCLRFGLGISRNFERPEDVVHTLKLVQNILDQNPWAVNQHSVDETLLTITTLLGSDSKITITNAKPSHLLRIFTRIVTTLSTLFQKHRRKLGGRWAQILDTLKGILRNLFEPFLDLRHKDIIPQSAWMQEVRVGNLRRQDIELFSRLLSTICDPSHQALRRRQNKQTKDRSLNDTSKAARAIAGQHMQHFVAELCTLQLRGKIADRDALNPGIYAVFGAMTADVQRDLNDGLDAQARIIFKVLYDDWRTFGKWDGR